MMEKEQYFQVKILIREYLKDNKEIIRVFWIPDLNKINLLVITTSVPSTGELLPMVIPVMRREISMPVQIMLLHPKDSEKILRGEIMYLGKEDDLSKVIAAAFSQDGKIVALGLFNRLVKLLIMELVIFSERERKNDHEVNG